MTVVNNQNLWDEMLLNKGLTENGKIIAKIQGANAPLINRKVINLIDEERKIAAGEIARPQYVEIPLVDPNDEEYGDVQYESAVEVYNMAIVKPDDVLMRKNVDVKEKVTKEGFVIEIQDNMILPEEVVREFYIHISDQCLTLKSLYFL
ncbi:Thioredoxin domain-containing protein 3 [Apodemus speciosus]|uniref:Thioredoxin domain-containing protein 3 n=1 Tax=Apodemus speciosus TaxID=105296 RepID=A0ABQ0FFD9_APOSI